MARHNSATATVRKGSGAIKTTGITSVNHNGGIGYARDARSELFLAAVTSLNEDTYYESAVERAERIGHLVSQDGIYNDLNWSKGLVTWLRDDAKLRAVPTMLASHIVHTRLSNGLTGGNREIIAASIGRLDETSDVLAYWMQTFGRKIPSAVKRGINDALATKLNEGSFLKWNGRMSNGSISLADVLNLTHPKPSNARQSALFSAVLDNAYGAEMDTTNLPILDARAKFLAMSRDEQIEVLSGANAEKIMRDARLTHEVIAGAIGVIPAKVWKNLIPQMGYTALRMNLRRIEESGVSQKTISDINEVLSDADAAEASGTMPIAFLSAYRNAPLDFAGAIQRGANGILRNVPALSGKSLILVDSSASMEMLMSEHGTMNRFNAAAMFGAALALRAENADLYSYSNHEKKVPFTKNKGLIRLAESIPFIGHGTDTFGSLDNVYDGSYDRVVILTDEQTGYNGGWFGHSSKTLDEIVPSNVPVYTWNLAGYSHGHAENKVGRYTFGGLSDKGMQMIPLLEAGYDEKFPWEK